MQKLYVALGCLLVFFLSTHTVSFKSEYFTMAKLAKLILSFFNHAMTTQNFWKKNLMSKSIQYFLF